MSLTKRQAMDLFNSPEWKKRRQNTVYLTEFDSAKIYRAGKKDKSENAFDNLRYAEDDRPEERWDKRLEKSIKKTNEIITYEENNKIYVLARSGGVSLFDGISQNRKMGKNDTWHIIMKAPEKKLDPDLIIEKKLKANHEGLYHYSIQPNKDMLLSDFIKKLGEAAKIFFTV